MPEDPPPPTWRAHWPALLVALLGAVVALWAKAVLFPELSWNRDEPVYLWQMEVLRDGRLAAPDGGYPRLFLPWLSAARDGELFGQYTPGWPVALLLARLVTGTATAALPAAAALCAGGTYALAFELLRRRDVAVVAGVLMVASPIFALQGGVHLAYIFSLGLGLSASALVLSGARRRRWARLALGGGLLGWVFLTRPFDALVWGGVLAVHLLWVERPRWRATLLHLTAVGAAALPFVVVGLLYNRRLTGTLLEFPMSVKDPLDAFGFGNRRLAPSFEAVDYGLGTALRASAKNAFFFPWFLAGTYVGLGAAVVAAVRWWRRPSTWLLLGLGVAFPLAYLPFWGTYLSSLASRISGPIYLVPLYAPVCILVAALLVEWRTHRPRWATGLAVLLVIGTIPAAWDRFALNRDISRAQAPWRDSLAAVEDPSLVLVADSTYVLYANPFGANPPDLTGPRLFAVPEGPEVLDLIAAHPDRAVYLQAGDVPSQELGPREQPADLDVVVSPAKVIRAPAVTLRPELRLPSDQEVTVTVATGDEERSWSGRPDELPERLVAGTVDGADLSLGAEGSIEVTLAWPTDGRDAAPVLRARLLYRQSDGEVEVLSPALWQRWTWLTDREGEWQHALEAPEAELTVSPVG
jgi:4-amino-4-deoxy-L-arabinose transferase-like glycosyltransferase